MEQLIAINHSEGGPVVSARALHEFLESRQDFTTWAKGRLSKYGFVEGVDFTTILGKTPSGVGRPSVDYALTLDTAKELAMVEANEKGQQARRYFIEKEKELRGIQQEANLLQSPAELILMLAQQNVETERRLGALEQQLQEVNARLLTSDSEYYTVAGYASLLHLPMPPMLASIYGKQAAALSRERSIAIGSMHDARYGKVGTYHQDILREVFYGKR